MQRRTALRLLGATAAVAALPDDLTAVGRSIHQHVGGAGLQVLDPHQNATVTTLTDLILPETDTPGAKAAKVNEFIDLLLSAWVDPPDKDKFLAGLADVDTRAKAAFGKTFVEGSVAEQTGVLTALDDETARWSAMPDAAKGPEPFYHQLKWVTLFGYYTSEVGAQASHYEIIPLRYVPCAPADSAASE